MIIVAFLCFLGNFQVPPWPIPTSRKYFFFRCSLPKGMSISRSEIFLENKNAKCRCSLPSPLQKRSKDYKGLHRIHVVLVPSDSVPPLLHFFFKLNPLIFSAASFLCFHCNAWKLLCHSQKTWLLAQDLLPFYLASVCIGISNSSPLVTKAKWQIWGGGWSTWKESKWLRG